MNSETLQERLSRECREKFEERTLQPPQSEALQRMNRMNRCYKSAAKKIVKMQFKKLHKHEQESLLDAVEFGSPNLRSLIRNLRSLSTKKN